MHLSDTLKLFYLASVAFAQHNPIKHPTLGEVINAGQEFLITWHPTTSNPVNLVLKEGDANDLDLVYTIATGVPNTGSYLWTSDIRTVTKAAYSIMIQDSIHKEVTNFSPYFTILGLHAGNNSPTFGDQREIPKKADEVDLDTKKVQKPKDYNSASEDSSDKVEDKGSRNKSIHKDESTTDQNDGDRVSLSDKARNDKELQEYHEREIEKENKKANDAKLAKETVNEKANSATTSTKTAKTSTSTSTSSSTSSVQSSTSSSSGLACAAVSGGYSALFAAAIAVLNAVW